MNKNHLLTNANAIKIAKKFKILGHPIRIKIICLLDGNKKMSVSEILSHLQEDKIDQPTLSHHLIKLKNANILKSKKSGLHVYYELASERLVQIISNCIE
jgi:ArsR family transcriptional regulator